jgi:RHH-type proline utilization regulon transcriptional repressor/proline dehydrogenase/delta 1-pyrroline-5-carboxylate dehydrogenase
MTAAGRLLEPDPQQDPRRLAIQQVNAASETEAVEALLDAADLGRAARGRLADHAARLVEQIRADKSSYGGLDAFIQEYDLSNQEGVVLMCLAEALLRVPDAATAANASRHYRSYVEAIAAVGRVSGGRGPFAGPVHLAPGRRSSRVLWH